MKAQFRTKYGAVKIEINGRRFDSRKEGDRYRDLLLLEAAGEIHCLELQPRYELQAAFNHRGTKYRAISYTADFRYWEKGDLVVEDVKSPPTRRKTDYVIRKKLFLKQHPEIVFKET